MTPERETKQTTENAPEKTRENLLNEAFDLLMRMNEQQIVDLLKQIVE